MVGTTADFRRFRPPQPLPINHLLGENCGTRGRIGEVGLIDSLRAGRVDAAFIRSPSREVDGLLVVSIIEEEMLIALPSRHDLAASASLPLKALTAEPFILFPRANSPELYDDTVLACRRGSFSPNIFQQAPEVATALKDRKSVV